MPTLYRMPTTLSLTSVPTLLYAHRTLSDFSVRTLSHPIYSHCPHSLASDMSSPAYPPIDHSKGHAVKDEEDMVYYSPNASHNIDIPPEFNPNHYLF
ncbi:hypothetical protein BDQ17DRAFT_1422980 [Cyathus striatus]|nr:hypothetical protein BDQ17DRAFT_1422980 [Cyathus striatus]